MRSSNGESLDARRRWKAVCTEILLAADICVEERIRDQGDPGTVLNYPIPMDRSQL
ncbi:hypothetical protein SCLCIDRAFT_1209205 [Scleroderma citrinum Foug A]|uniref:Uncharacterized protein n=1 Tax=Scleroderma citrinum Foug A TaxID=1036808 RepID=A0A0C3ATU5_9AGAM|nr:hypothetical protein SCLCIDRAFT_1209205 [Scleroderma citrinum Foug A]